jgi:putative protease
MKKPELLAPAGDFEKMKTAFRFGADAVYLGGERFGLRVASKNFGDEELEKAVHYAHEQGKKIHVTLNTIAHNEDLEGLTDYVRTLERLGIDAVIVADPGIFSIVRDTAPSLKIHISTQASTTNYASVNYWHKQGASRAVLARELSLKEIREIRRKIPREMELEIFVHGAMCISYSGRCLLSNYMTGRDANRGDCAQACRWSYGIVEEKRPGEYFPVEEDARGTTILNSKDLCLLGRIPELMEAGIDSFKIEGRVKSQYYVATAVHAYRQAIDAYAAGRWSEELAAELQAEVEKASHRDFTTGFLDGLPGEKGQRYSDSGYLRTYEFVGLVLDYNEETGTMVVEQRNRIRRGDELELFGKDPGFRSFVVEKMRDETGEDIDVAPRAQQVLYIPVDFPVEAGDMIRKKNMR